MSEYTWALSDSVDTAEEFDLSEEFSLSDPAASFIFSDFLGGATVFQTLSTGYILVASFIRQIQVTLRGGVAWVASRVRLQNVLGWDYSGDLAPGDRVKVDYDRRSITHNGVNARHLTTGEFPYFAPGPNALIYSDDEESRQVRLRVLWRGRWI